MFSLVREKAEKVLKRTDSYLVGISPDEEVGKGKFRNQRWGLDECLVEEGFFLER